MKINGNWLMLMGDEDFDRRQNRMVALSGEGFDGDKVLRELGEGERLVLSRFHEDGVIEGLIYQGGVLPEGDPKGLWDELADADDDDPRFDELPTSHRVRLYREDIVDEVFGDGVRVAAND